MDRLRRLRTRVVVLAKSPWSGWKSTVTPSVTHLPWHFHQRLRSRSNKCLWKWLARRGFLLKSRLHNTSVSQTTGITVSRSRHTHVCAYIRDYKDLGVKRFGDRVERDGCSHAKTSRLRASENRKREHSRIAEFQNIFIRINARERVLDGMQINLFPLYVEKIYYNISPRARAFY